MGTGVAGAGGADLMDITMQRHGLRHMVPALAARTLVCRVLQLPHACYLPGDSGALLFLFLRVQAFALVQAASLADAQP